MGGRSLVAWKLIKADDKKKMNLSFKMVIQKFGGSA